MTPEPEDHGEDSELDSEDVEQFLTALEGDRGEQMLQLLQQAAVAGIGITDGIIAQADDDSSDSEGD